MKKRQKQDEQLLHVCLPTHLHHLAVDRSVLESNTVVIDGGGDNNQQLTLPSFFVPKSLGVVYKYGMVIFILLIRILPS